MKSALALFLVIASTFDLPPDVITARDAIRGEAISAHIRFLADDLLEGRETGSRGFEIAARYVAAHFSAYGLQPGGDDGTYFQHIRFRSSHVDNLHSALVLHDGKRDVPLEMSKDFYLRPSLRRETDEVTAPLVFASFGIVAPELGHDDYASINARGKIVVIITGAPSRFPHDQRAYYSSVAVKEEIAAAHGAVGILSLRSNIDEARFSFAKTAKQSDSVAMRFIDAKGEPSGTLPQIRGDGSISRTGATKLFTRSPKPVEQLLADADKDQLHSFPLNVSATIHTTSIFGEAQSENVVAILPGSDPMLRSEHVVVSAHLDHLGDHAAGTDRIYNGAYDNASGIAALLEIARAFASLPQAPARSLVFIAFTGEEKGIQGSGYFVDHPPGTLVANVNMDMFLMLFPAKDLIAYGGEHTSLGTLARRASESTGLTISPDPSPEEVRFIRSDQYSFVKHGVPAISLKTGLTSTDPALDGDKLTKDWLRNVYHTPKDDLQQPFDLPTGVKYTQTNFLIAWGAANGAEKPTWNAGDFFGAKFGK